MVLAFAISGGALAQGNPPPRDTTVLRVDAVDTRPVLLSHPPLVYPESLRAVGVQGRVILRFIIDTAGHPEIASIIVVSGVHPDLDSSAVTMVRQAVFSPAKLRNRSVPVLVEIPVNFTIPDVPDRVYAVDEVDSKPERLSGPMPEYPLVLAEARVSGAVYLRAILDTTGHVERGSVQVDSTTDMGFNKSAIAMVSGSVFKPARLRGRVVRVLIKIPVSYSIGRAEVHKSP